MCDSRLLSLTSGATLDKVPALSEREASQGRWEDQLNACGSAKPCSQVRESPTARMGPIHAPTPRLPSFLPTSAPSKQHSAT